MELKLKIVTGTSFFTGREVVGVSLASESDPRGLTKLAEDIGGKRRRPASVEMHRNEFSGQELADRWNVWAEDCGHTIEWAPTEAVPQPF